MGGADGAPTATVRGNPGSANRCRDQQGQDPRQQSPMPGSPTDVTTNVGIDPGGI
jgi:hypothetical protein